MVAIVVPQPDGTAGDLARPRRPADLADVTVLRPRAVARSLPDRATRVRRRRLVVLLVALALVAGGVVGAGAVLDAVGSVPPSPPRVVELPSPQPAVGETYVVQPGDTLWSIAATIAPDSDPRPVVDALRDANGGPDLQVGQRLTVVVD